MGNYSFWSVWMRHHLPSFLCFSTTNNLLELSEKQPLAQNPQTPKCVYARVSCFLHEFFFPVFLRLKSNHQWDLIFLEKFNKLNKINSKFWGDKLFKNLANQRKIKAPSICCNGYYFYDKVLWPATLLSKSWSLNLAHLCAFTCGHSIRYTYGLIK